MEKVVVIGGSGFMGSHVADQLTKSGYEVYIYDIAPSKWLKDNQKMIVGDILDIESLRKCIKGAKYVYHFAGVADIGEAGDGPYRTIESNVMGASVCLEACVHENVERILYASTMYVYSNKGSFYRASKQAAEVLIEAYAEKFGIDYTFLRYGSLYGDRSQSWNGLRKYVIQAVRDGKIVYNGTGKERREYIHVHDAAKLSVEAVGSEYKNSSLIITGTQILNSSELLSMIVEIMGNNVKVEFNEKKYKDNDHYVTTPYRYTPKSAKKIISNEFVDIGQGILSLIEEVSHELKDID